MNEINLNKQVFDKQAFDNTIDTSFSELTTSTQLVTSSSAPTVEQFFLDYQNLFYTIPKFGDANSHEYLVINSQAYIGTIGGNDDLIDALIAEVTELRNENNSLQQEIANNVAKSAEDALTQLQATING
mgnify:CR=1 FL=1|tara:strand:+ start:2145 stop:2531 length:387 start_codon:yes stop_codon:yes gene_type:complete